MLNYEKYLLACSKAILILVHTYSLKANELPIKIKKAFQKFFQFYHNFIHVLLPLPNSKSLSHNSIQPSTIGQTTLRFLEQALLLGKNHGIFQQQQRSMQQKRYLLNLDAQRPLPAEAFFERNCSTTSSFWSTVKLFHQKVKASQNKHQLF